MKYARLGRSGLRISKLVLGCMTYGTASWRPWVLDEKQGGELIAQALDAGINCFDTANIYSSGESERILGNALRNLSVRDNVVIATKVFGRTGPGPNDCGLSAKHIIHAVDSSLKNLCTDYIDLYQIHRFDSETPAEETLRALDTLVKSGKVRYIGASTMFAWQLMKMLSVSNLNGLHHFCSMQAQYNLVYRNAELEMLPLCRDQGLAFLPWSPLARGFLTKDHRRPLPSTRAETDEIARALYFRDSDYQVADAVSEVAAERGVSRAQIALAWALANPVITAPIIGVSRRSHLDEAVQALDISLTSQELQVLERSYVPNPTLDH